MGITHYIKTSLKTGDRIIDVFITSIISLLGIDTISGTTDKDFELMFRYQGHHFNLFLFT